MDSNRAGLDGGIKVGWPAAYELHANCVLYEPMNKVQEKTLPLCEGQGSEFMTSSFQMKYGT